MILEVGFYQDPTNIMIVCGMAIMAIIALVVLIKKTNEVDAEVTALGVQIDNTEDLSILEVLIVKLKQHRETFYDDKFLDKKTRTLYDNALIKRQILISKQ